MRLSLLVLLGAWVSTGMKTTSDSEDIFNTDTVAAALSVADDMNNIFADLNPNMEINVQEPTEEEKSTMPPVMAAMSSDAMKPEDDDQASLLSEEPKEEKEKLAVEEKKDAPAADAKNGTAISDAIKKEEEQLEKEEAVLDKMKKEEKKEKEEDKTEKKKEKKREEKVEVVKNLEAAILSDKTAKANAPKKGFATPEEEAAADQKAAMKLDEKETKEEMHDAAYETVLKDAAEKVNEGRSLTSKDLYDPVGDDEALPPSKSDKIVEMITGLQNRADTLMKGIRAARRGNTKESIIEAARLLEEYGKLKVQMHDAVMKYASPEDFMGGFPKPHPASADEMPGWTQPFAPALPPAQSMDEAKPIMRPANPRINAEDTIIVYNKLKKPIVPFILPSSSVSGYKKPSLLPRIECPANKLPC